MNFLLDMVVCGPRMCGGVAQILSVGESSTDICGPKKWRQQVVTVVDPFADDAPPIPKVIEVSVDSQEGDDDSVSLLSELEVGKAYTRYRELLAAHLNEPPPCEPDDEEEVEDAEEEHDLLFKEEDASRAKSEFDNRSGDTRYMMDNGEELKGTRVVHADFDDGSSYSSFYFRIRPSKSQEPWPEEGLNSLTYSRNSRETTSTQPTEPMQNLSSQHRRYDSPE